MKKALLITAAWFGCAFFHTAFADHVTADMTIKTVVANEDGWLIQLYPAPSNCVGSYNGFHGFVGGTDDDLIANILVARNTGVTMTITYAYNGNCTQEEGVAGLVELISVK